MASERTYSTREVAQMWNVSESTVKRWADAFGLRCYRTPGGHRRFRLEDICEFQQKRAFEATGLLTTEDWEDPELEVWLNSKNYTRVRELLFYLAGQNQRPKVRCLLERLYLRGMRLEEIYEDVLVPLGGMVAGTAAGKLTSGQALLVRNNIEEALFHLSPKIIRRRPNGKTALCAAPGTGARLPVGVLSRVLEVEGWDVLNLGEEVSFRIMSETVRTEPVNLVCIFADAEGCKGPPDGIQDLNEVTLSYRIPVLLATPGTGDCALWRDLAVDARFGDLRDLRKHLMKLSG
jgi:MerR family transcriptional regulator, light-induced transcriptional regulator